MCFATSSGQPKRALTQSTSSEKSTGRNNRSVLSTKCLLQLLVASALLVTLAWTDFSLIKHLDFVSNMKTLSDNYIYSGTTSSGLGTGHPKYAVAHYVESLDQLYGVYSVHNQMLRFGMQLSGMTLNGTNGTQQDGQVRHVALIPTTIERNHSIVLSQWLGEENVITVDIQLIRKKMENSTAMWLQTFSKLFIFNLTQFDKILLMDTDILVRANLMHWFGYPAPCGTQQKGDIAWNSGAMVIEPSTEIFNQMIEPLALLNRYNSSHAYEKDPLNGGYSDQDYIAAFFLNKTMQPGSKRRCVMPIEAAILSSSLPDKRFDYFNKMKPYIYETVHFTTSKPWRGSTQHGHQIVLRVFRGYRSITAPLCLCPPT